MQKNSATEYPGLLFNANVEAHRDEARRSTLTRRHPHVAIRCRDTQTHAQNQREREGERERESEKDAHAHQHTDTDISAQAHTHTRACAGEQNLSVLTKSPTQLCRKP